MNSLNNVNCDFRESTSEPVSACAYVRVCVRVLCFVVFARESSQAYLILDNGNTLESGVAAMPRAEQRERRARRELGVGQQRQKLCAFRFFLSHDLLLRPRGEHTRR